MATTIGTSAKCDRRRVQRNNTSRSPRKAPAMCVLMSTASTGRVVRMVAVCVQSTAQTHLSRYVAFASIASLLKSRDLSRLAEALRAALFEVLTFFTPLLSCPRAYIGLQLRRIDFRQRMSNAPNGLREETRYHCLVLRRVRGGIQELGSVG